MFEVRRQLFSGYVIQGGYKIGTYGDIEDIEAAISGGSVKANDRIMFVWHNNCQSRFGYVNSSNAIVLTPQ